MRDGISFETLPTSRPMMALVQKAVAKATTLSHALRSLSWPPGFGLSRALVWRMEALYQAAARWRQIYAA